MHPVQHFHEQVKTGGDALKEVEEFQSIPMKLRIPRRQGLVVLSLFVLALFVVKVRK